MQPFSLIEPLEPRIAPATLINPNTVTYTDIDGDSVVVKISKPLFISAAVANTLLEFSTGSVNGSNATGQSLDTINLLGVTAAQDMNISVTVLPKLGVGNGEANVGYIAAANVDPETFQFSKNIDLGVVRIQGNLGRIDVGDKVATPALAKLDVDSMNQALVSNVLGPITNFHVRGDFDGAQMKVYGSAFGNIGKLTIDGALKGEGFDNGGQIFFTGRINSATIGSIVGGSGAFSGTLVGTFFRTTSIGDLHVLGSITGGDADALTGATAANSGSVTVQRLENVQIDGGLIGGSGSQSALVYGKASVGSVSIAGGIQGGAGGSSAVVTSDKTIANVSIGGDVTGGEGDNSGEIFASNSIQHIHLGGSLKGGNGSSSGEIFTVNLNTLQIDHDLVGGAAGTASSAGNSGSVQVTNANSIIIVGSVIGGDAVAADTAHTANTSGVISVSNTLKTVSIGGDLKGGTGANSGAITGSQFLNINIAGNVQGGAGTGSGLISATSPVLGANLTIKSGVIKALHIGGSVLGGAGNSSGEIVSASDLTATIDHDLTGGTVSQDTALTQSGYIQAAHISNLTIGGNVTAGLNSGTGGSASSGSIRATTDIDTLLIKGNLQGSVDNTDPENPIISNAIISATGQTTPAADATTNVAIKSLTVLGNVDRAEILAGYNTTTSTSARGNAVNADAQIDSITIQGNLSATDIVAGATSGTDNFFGDANDVKPSGTGIADSASVISKISSVIVLGQTVTGSTNSAEHFGIVAENVVSVTTGSNPPVTLTLASGPSNDNVAISDNFRVVEIA